MRVWMSVRVVERAGFDHHAEGLGAVFQATGLHAVRAIGQPPVCGTQYFCFEHLSKGRWWLAVDEGAASHRPGRLLEAGGRRCHRTRVIVPCPVLNSDRTSLAHPAVV